MLTDVETYLAAVFVQWRGMFAFATFIPGALAWVTPEPTLTRIRTKLDEVVTLSARQRMYRVLFLIGVFVAGFFAWREQYQIALSKSPEAVQSQVQRLTTELDEFKARE